MRIELYYIELLLVPFWFVFVFACLGILIVFCVCWRNLPGIAGLWIFFWCIFCCAWFPAGGYLGFRLFWPLLLLWLRWQFFWPSAFFLGRRIGFFWRWRFLFFWRIAGFHGLVGILFRSCRIWGCWALIEILLRIRSRCRRIFLLICRHLIGFLFYLVFVGGRLAWLCILHQFLYCTAFYFLTLFISIILYKYMYRYLIYSANYYYCYCYYKILEFV